MESESSRYDDIIDLPHYRSKKRSHMDISARAAQFASFDALAGRSESEKERERMMKKSRQREGDSPSGEDDSAQV